MNSAVSHYVKVEGLSSPKAAKRPLSDDELSIFDSGIGSTLGSEGRLPMERIKEEFADETPSSNSFQNVKKIVEKKPRKAYNPNKMVKNFRYDG